MKRKGKCKLTIKFPSDAKDVTAPYPIPAPFDFTFTVTIRPVSPLQAPPIGAKVEEN